MSKQVSEEFLSLNLPDDLPPFDPTRLAIGFELPNGKSYCVNREKQFINLFLSHGDLVHALGLPSDHRVVRVVLTEERCEPGILIMCEGPAGMLTQHAMPVAIEEFHQFLENVDEKRHAASEYWLRKAVERRKRGFGT